MTQLVGKQLMLHNTQIRYVSNYKIAVAFNNGESGVADLSPIVQKGVFQRLSAAEKFAQVAVDEELETVAWPGGLDSAPEFVYFQAFKHQPEHQAQFKTWGYLQ